jgi:hypothetical protein
LSEEGFAEVSQFATAVGAEHVVTSDEDLAEWSSTVALGHLAHIRIDNRQTAALSRAT